MEGSCLFVPNVTGTNIICAHVCAVKRLPMRESMIWRFGQKLRYLRTRSHLTQIELAKRLHLASHAHISNLETSRFEPSLDVVIAVSEIFAVQVEYLVREKLPEHAVEEQQRGARKEIGVQFFGPNLARLRVQAGVTQVQLAEQLRLAAHAHISFLESGKKQPSIELILRVADRFGVTADQLLSAPMQ